MVPPLFSSAAAALFAIAALDSFHPSSVTILEYEAKIFPTFRVWTLEVLIV